MDALCANVNYILQKQQETKMRLVNIIYLEEWVINKVPESFYQQSVTKFEKWPPEEGPKIIKTIGSNEIEEVKSETEKHSLDYVITIGGDGTILTLLRNMQEYEKTRILPPIVTFSQVN